MISGNRLSVLSPSTFKSTFVGFLLKAVEYLFANSLKFPL